MTTLRISDPIDRVLRCVGRRKVAAGCVLVLLATLVFLPAGPLRGQQAAAADNWDRDSTQLTQFHFERYSPTRPNTRIKGTYVTEMPLGAMAGRSEVYVQCAFTFWDSQDATNCGTGKVKFTATIGDKTIFKRKTVKFSHDRCHTAIWYGVTLDLSDYEAMDEFVCTAKVIDNAKLPPVDTATITYQAYLRDVTWDAEE